MERLVQRYYYAIFALCGGLCMVFSYQLGVEQGKGSQAAPITLSCTSETLQKLALPVSDLAAGTVPDRPTTGKYMGSKNGTKYYVPGCSAAKRIKPENYVWFSTADDAILQGYTPGKC